MPDIIGGPVRTKKAKVRILLTQNEWFGATYQEGRDTVKMTIQRLVEDGAYSDDLFADMSRK